VVVLTEALQGMADVLTSGLLWLGVHRSKKRPNKEHRFGYGKELFFWILMAGISMFILTAGFSFYFGLMRLLHPAPVHNLPVAFLSLGIGLVTNLYALRLSLQRLHIRYNSSVKVLWDKLVSSTYIETKATIILDAMGSTASFLGIGALATYALTGNERFDGLGAMVVGVACAVFAVLLISEVKDFIVGRSASAEVEEAVREAAERVEGIRSVLDLRTMQMGSEKVLVNMEVHIEPHLRTIDIEELMDVLKERVKSAVPAVQHIQVEIETPARRNIHEQ
jgi:cation diffusion facilitator family transporter